MAFFTGSFLGGSGGGAPGPPGPPASIPTFTQATKPTTVDVPVGTMALWRDTTNNKDFFIVNLTGSSVSCVESTI